MKHSYANIFNSTSVLNPKKIEDRLFCNCGCNRGAGEQFPILMNEQNLTFLGPGVLLFFVYLRHIRLTIAMAFLIYGAFSLATNIITFSANPKYPCPTDTDAITLYYCQYNVMSSSDNKLTYPFLNYLQLVLGFVFSFVWVCSIKMIKYLGELKDRHITDL